MENDRVFIIPFLPDLPVMFQGAQGLKDPAPIEPLLIDGKPS
jgi:hypothetical protein